MESKTTANEKIAAFLDRRFNGEIEPHPFWMYEPFDIAERPEWVMELARKDGMDLETPEMLEFFGKTPSPFQSGYLLSTARSRTLLAGTKVGKAQPYTASIYGEFGHKFMGQIVLGDKVFGEDGNLHNIIGIHEQGERDVYTVEFNDGSKTECDIEHLWKIYRPDGNESSRRSHGKSERNPFLHKMEVVSLKDLINRYGMSATGRLKRWGIPLASRVSWRENSHIILPYSLGVLLGDGNYTSKATSFTCSASSEDLIKRVESEVGIKGHYSYHGRTPQHFISYGGGVIRKELDRMELGGKKSEFKFIPSEYLFDSDVNRLELLRGLMDTDGSIYGKLSCEYYSKSEQLAEDVAFLVKSLGGKAYISEKDSHYTKNGIRTDCGVGYRVRIKMRKDNPFFTKRKAARWHPGKKVDWRRFKKVYYSGRKPCRCLLIDSDEHTYLTDDFIVTHNTYVTFIELGIMVSGEKPISLRFDKGVKTGVKRLVTEENIIRFGRFDSSNENFIDHDYKAKQPTGWSEWDCGFITGVGVYPDEKILSPGEVCWVGTTQKALQELWWPRLTDSSKSILPMDFINHRRGNEGSSKLERIVHCVRDTHITVISYEAGYRKFEAADMVKACVFDEESPDEACETAAITHCKYFSRVMTPYNGMTYTRKKIFDPKKNKKENVVFHCTAYDSPYLTLETIDHRREMMAPYEIGARIWGLHTEAKGKPYFDRVKINGWIRSYITPFSLYRFTPTEDYDGILSREDREKPGLLSVEISVVRNLPSENQQDIWRVYEDYDENTPYFVMADSAEGSDIPGESADVLASLIMRPPRGEEQFPQIVASLRSTMKTQNFARTVMYATCYYGHALLCAEGPTRGSFNALFYAENQAYPFWYNHTSTRDSTKRTRTVHGFDTNAASRGAIFDNITDLLNSFDVNERPEINDEPLLIELSACVIEIKNGKPRPNHTEQSTLDSAICFGQGLWVHKFCSNQIKIRKPPKEKPDGFLNSFFRANKLDISKPSTMFLGECKEVLR